MKRRAEKEHLVELVKCGHISGLLILIVSLFLLAGCRDRSTSAPPAITVASGRISAKGRRTGVSDGSFEDFLQTDAPINQGNSGGALINTNSALVGINSQILSPNGGSIGIGFAIPSNMARNVMEQLIQRGSVRRGRLGIAIQ